MRRAEIRHAVFGMLDEDVLIEKVPNRGMVDRRRESRKCMRAAYSKQQKRHRKKMKARVEHEHDGVDKYEDDELPEEGDATLLAAAPELLEAVERLLIGAAACAIPHPKEREVLQMAVDFAIQAKRKAKGGE